MSIFGKKTKPKLSDGNFDKEALLDTVLYRVPGTKTDITWADSVEGQLITGATGSGKSSGPGRFSALAQLRAGYGFCILCAKPDEKDRWVKYARETNRENDVVIFNKESGLKFNFLKYEMERAGEGAGDVLNAINALMNLNEQNRVYQSGGSGKEERFWDNSLRRLISRVISLLNLAGEEVSVPNMRKAVINCFLEDELEVYEELIKIITTKKAVSPEKRKEALQDLELWADANYLVKLLVEVGKKKANTDAEEDEIRIILNYWLKEFPRLSDRTSSIIKESYFGILEPFLNRGILKEQFSYGLSEDLLPEKIILNHKIVIIDFPIKEYGIAAIYAATIYKSVFQSAMERRTIENEENPKPIGLWVDEYQSFCNPMTDSLFQTTARSSWVAVTYITQSINNLYFVMGNNMPQARAKSLLGNMNLKYFCSNADIETGTWASNMIGRHLADVESYSFQADTPISKTKNQQLQYRISPDHFTTLKTGRKQNGYIVEAIVFKPGKSWNVANDNYAKIEFKQR